MADIERLPCGVEHELRADAAIIRSWIDVANGPINREALADRLDRYANAAAELTAEIEALRAEVNGTIREMRIENARLREALREARDAIEDWAGYASDYFREKHDLAGELAKIDALLRDQEEGHEQ